MNANKNTKPAATALATVKGVDLTDLDVLVSSGLLTREQIQAYMTNILGNAKVPGGDGALKATRVARAFLRLAALAEEAAGYDEATFVAYAKKAYRKQVGAKKVPGAKAAKVAQAFSSGSVKLTVVKVGAVKVKLPGVPGWPWLARKRPFG
jgi:hypothetical protein